MGRKPNASKLLTKSSMPESTNTSLGRSEQLPHNSKPSLDRENSKLESPNPPSPVLKHVEGMATHLEKSPAREEEKAKSELERKSTSHRRRKSVYYSSGLRRSQRIKTPVVLAPNHDIDTYVEDVIVSDNENDETNTQMENILSEPEANLGEQSLKEKVDYVLQRLQAFEKIIESLQPKVDKNIDLDGTTSSASALYRSLYIESQNKLEAMRDENRRLTGKLENALGKIEVLEKQNDVLIEMWQKLKDLIMLSNMSKTTEAALNASRQAIENASAASASKRKKRTQES